MTQFIDEKEIKLFLLDERSKENFEHRIGSTELTDFESFWLQKTGDLIRPKDSQFFWVDNSYCWWEREFDEKGNPVKDHEFSVWLDKKGNCMYENHDEEKLYRVMF